MPRKGGVPENLKPAKKGEVRNPKGRPKGSGKVNLLKALEEELKKPTRIQIDGKRQTMTMEEAIAKSAAARALKDHRYFKTIIEQFHGFPTAKHEIEGSMSIIDELYDRAKKHKGEGYGNGKNAKK